MAVSPTVILTLLYYSLLTAHTLAKYGDPYPLSASWFKDRTSVPDVEQTLSTFQSLGGDTVLLRGAEFVNSTAANVKRDPQFLQCTEGGKHCVDIAKDELGKKGLQVQAWVTYSYEEAYSKQFVTCKGYDKQIIVGKLVYHRLVLWLEQYKTADDCGFVNGSRVAVLFTSYTGKGDPHAILLEQAQSKNITVYLGLPKPPYISEDQSSGDLIQAFFQFNYRVIQDHKARFANSSAMKGYYSDVLVIPDYIINEQKKLKPGHNRLPPRFVVMFWRELYFLTGLFDFELVASPTIDLTHVSNTTLKGHMEGMQSVVFLSNLAHYILRDGRGDGRAAYFRADEKHRAIYDADYSLWQVLRSKNSSISMKTTFSDVYYASISDFMIKYKDLKIPTWWMVEAYNDIQDKNACEPVDPKASGMERRVQRVYKSTLDKALTHVGAMVQKFSAFAWDPLFTCTSAGFATLAQQIKQDNRRPIISECRFHSQQNQSIVVIGYNIDGPINQPFQVNYTLANGAHKSTSLYGYYYELDYGKAHGLIDSLVYIQLYDIPELRDLQKTGTIGVARTDGTGEPCRFNYTLSITNRNENGIYG